MELGELLDRAGRFRMARPPLPGRPSRRTRGPLLGELLTAGSSFNIWMTMLFGVLWGVGGLTFGLSMRYLGVALGQSIALGTCAGLGTVMGPVLLNIFFPENDPLSQLTFAVILGVIVTLAGIAIIGVAGSMKAPLAQPRGTEGRCQGLQLPQGPCYRPSCRLYERLLQRGPRVRQGHQLRRAHRPHVQHPARHLPCHPWRLRNQRGVLLLPEQPQQHLGRLRQRLGVAQQRLLLPVGRRTVVQPVLRPRPGQGLPHRIAHAHDAVVLHPHGPQRCLLKRLGHHPQGMEGLLGQDNRRACRRHHRAGNLVLPAPAGMTHTANRNIQLKTKQ